MLPPIHLSESQLEAGEKLRGIVRQPVSHESTPLIALVGLSGVGKDTLWSVIKDEFPQVKFVEYHSISRLNKPQVERSYVTTVIPAETVGLRWPGDIHLVRVRGMTEQEIRAYVSQRAPEHTTIERIVHHSLGIPLLAERLLSRDLSDGESELLAGTHLSTCWDDREDRSNLMDYLRMRPSPRIDHIFRHSTRPRNTFHDLSRVLERYETLQKAGIMLKSPFFQAKNSYGIYARQDKGMYGTLAEIYAPNITQDDYCTIRNELLPEGETRDLKESRHSERARFSVFGAGWSKVVIFIEPADKTADTVDIEGSSRKSASDLLNDWKQFELDKLQLPPSFSEDQKGKFFLCANEHYGATNLRVAWTIESLLQNLGLPYVVGYSCGQTYVYNPDRNIMEQPQGK